MISDPGKTRVLRPADVIMRVVTHIFNHQGRILAMCRILGRPNETHDLDYPLAGHLPMGTFDRSLAKLDGAERV